MKEIFIGSSKEGLEHAMQVAAALSEVKDVKPLLWTKHGDITFIGSVLRGHLGGNIYSKATGKWYR